MTIETEIETGAVHLEDVTVTLGGRPILDGVSADIRAGEFVAILGPNGAGKTTLLRVLLGLQPVTRGTVLIGDRAPRRGSSSAGYVPQGRLLDYDLPVRGRDLVALGIDGHRWGLPLFGQATKQRKIDAVIDAVDAHAYANAPVGRLSGGEQQRLLLAQAILDDPKLLLLDEPLASLDLHHQQEMVALIDRVSRERNATVLMVAHDVNPLLNVIDRVLYLAGGHVALGTVDEVIRTDVLSRLYGAPVEVFRASGRIFVVAE